MQQVVSTSPSAPADSKVQKLVILFMFEKMAIPLSEPTVLDICTAENDWLGYMECKQFLAELLDNDLLYRVPRSDLLNITQNGLTCLSLFYTHIPSSKRDSIMEYVNQNRMHFKKQQAYFCDYSKNEDGTYTVIMRVNTEQKTVLEIKMVVSTRQHAKFLYKNWVDMAAGTYEELYDILLG